GGNCCKNGIDDDGDGGVDCVDADCASDPACSESSCGNGNCCADGVDNDGNGLTDCQDPTCQSNDPFRCRENYMGRNDGIDNDGDGLTDCADPDCANNGTCGVCFEACGAAADCETSGAVCAKDAANMQSPGPQHFYAFDACMMP